MQLFVTFRRDIPVALCRIIKYKQSIVQYNSVDDFIKVYSHIVSFNNMFWLSYEPSSGCLLFLSKAKYTISNAIVIVQWNQFYFKCLYMLYELF